MRPESCHPPHSLVDRVTEILHGIPVTDPYRWLEDGKSSETREWLDAQDRYARQYLANIPCKELIRTRVCELVDVPKCESVLKCGNRYVFRKRISGEEQFSIYLRDTPEGTDQLLIDPAQRTPRDFTSVHPLHLSPDGRYLLYEVKHGGEKVSTFELLDICSRTVLSDALPRGYLRGFVFAPDNTSFYYVHEPEHPRAPGIHTVRHHVLGLPADKDAEIFRVSAARATHLYLVPGHQRLGFLVYRALDKRYTDFYLWPIGSQEAPQACIENADFLFTPILLDSGRILAVTNHDAPNLRIIEMCEARNAEPTFRDIIPERSFAIQSWAVTRNFILVSYVQGTETHIDIFDLTGLKVGEFPIEQGEAVQVTRSSTADDEVICERESFVRPPQLYRLHAPDPTLLSWEMQHAGLDGGELSFREVSFPSTDGTQIPMFLVGRSELFETGSLPTILTAYGGHGLSMTPQFSVFTTILMELGCLFALPLIRGGSEFGSSWHDAAKGRKRQVAISDFLDAAEWLIRNGRTDPARLAVFGGSNAGLLIGAAMVQRPESFRAVLCIHPLFDMLRYHRFDSAMAWKDEFGTAEDASDFAALASYSPYENIREGTPYPATMIISGDLDQSCNPMHARKMVARLQAASSSTNPVILDYRHWRGHVPVLPLLERIESLTDRLAFICHELGLCD